jgi:manganese transport protein
MKEFESAPASSGWRREQLTPSLPEASRTIAIPKGSGFWRKLFAFSGPGFLVAVGYMDPGNWATDLEGGSKFGCTLLSVIVLSNFMAILLQALCTRLGIVTGRDLAQACRDHYSKPVGIGLWFICELAVCACDLAEVIGSAIALKLLFNLPLTWGVCFTALDVLAVMYLQKLGFRYLEALVIALVLSIGICFVAEIIYSRPDGYAILSGILPRAEIISNPKMLYVAISILGATVMPHNLYLHSSIVQTRMYEQTPEGKAEAIRFSTIDSTMALMFALFINAAILIVAATVFHGSGHEDVASIEEAHQLLSPLLGAQLASVLFALALLASGQNSTLTGTLAGQIVMEGFLNIRMRPWLRRLITRSMAIIPAVIVATLYGDAGTAKLLVLSQVILGMQLPFAVIPLVRFTSDRRKMGAFVNPTWLKFLAWLIAAVIVLLDVVMIVSLFKD